MALSAGTRLGTFEIVELIGVGGMGEVYRARDTNLGREVAIKVLPDAFAADPERLARFEREARLLAALDHPNIGALHEFRHNDGVHFLVMQLVDGETLAERLLRGPLGAEEAIPIFMQIAQALEAAHERGIVHRDLKPANVKITSDGTVKVLDFGVAKSFVDDEPIGGVTPTPSTPDATTLPATPSPLRSITGTSMLIGTPSYMSPEQARGKRVDKRTDIWAFGCCLYESLSGQKAFDGDTVADTISAITRDEPDMTLLTRNEINAEPFVRLLRLCLKKSPRERFGAIGDVRLLLLDVDQSSGTNEAHSPARKEGTLPLRRFNLDLKVTEAVEPFGVTVMPVLSADGQILVFASQKDGRSELYVRRVESDSISHLVGSSNAVFPFMSPDNEWIAYFDSENDQLKRIAVYGGRPQPLCEVRTPICGGCWLPDNTIVFSSETESGYGLFRVSAEGGDAKLLAKPDREKGEDSYICPAALPDGKHILFTLAMGLYIHETEVAVLDLETLEHRKVIDAGGCAQYLDSGHIAVYRESGLWAVPFDADALRPTGPQVKILSDLEGATYGGVATYTCSSDGLLIYAKDRRDREAGYAFITEGSEEFLLLTTSSVLPRPRVSPDGKKSAMAKGPAAWESDLWVTDLDRKSHLRVVQNGARNPVWSHDGQTIFFSYGPYRNADICRMRSDGRGPEEPDRVVESDTHDIPTAVSPDGNTLAFSRRNKEGKYDIWVDSLDGDSEQRIVSGTAGCSEMDGMFSPDGRWFSLVSDDTGWKQVYLLRRDGGPRYSVSIGGGDSPAWSDDSKRLYYRHGERIMYVDVLSEPEPNVSKPHLFRSVPGLKLLADRVVDGRGLVIKERGTGSEGNRFAPLYVIENWFEELKKLPEEGTSA